MTDRNPILDHLTREELRRIAGKWEKNLSEVDKVAQRPEGLRTLQFAISYDDVGALVDAAFRLLHRETTPSPGAPSSAS